MRKGDTFRSVLHGNYIGSASRIIVKGLKYRLPTLIYLPAFQKPLTSR